MSRELHIVYGAPFPPGSWSIPVLEAELRRSSARWEGLRDYLRAQIEDAERQGMTADRTMWTSKNEEHAVRARALYAALDKMDELGQQ